MPRAIIQTPTQRYDARVSEEELAKLEGQVGRDQFIVFDHAGVEVRLNASYIQSVTVLER